jgi:gamma-glutamylcyclotransferase
VSDYYFAYGSNLNLTQFSNRCPDADRINRCTLTDYKLVFRGVADIVEAPGHSVEGAVYKITPDCERALDMYEGYPRLYTKRAFVASIGKKGLIVDVMFYVMQDDYIAPPSQSYLNCIREGYDDWHIPHDSLDTAVKHADRQYAKARRAEQRRFDSLGYVHPQPYERTSRRPNASFHPRGPRMAKTGDF